MGIGPNAICIRRTARGTVSLEQDTSGDGIATCSQAWSDSTRGIIAVITYR